MTSKERVKRAIGFGKPDRIPNHLPEPYPSDISWIFPKMYDKATEERDGSLFRLSEFGSWWKEGSEQNMGEVVEPALPDWQQYERYQLPPLNEPERYAHAQKVIDTYPDRYIMGVLSISLFPHYWEIRGFENFFTDSVFERERMEDLLDKIVEMQLESVRIWSGYEVDGIVVGFDDWGLQDRLMISPEMWREVFKPRYKLVWDAVHAAGMDVILHSCGDITSIMDDMIEIGLDVINMDQQQNMGLENLARRFGGRVCFWNPTDIQTVMLSGDDKYIRSYTKRMIELLGSFDGGFIGKYYPQPLAVGHSEEASRASFETFLEEGAIY